MNAPTQSWTLEEFLALPDDGYRHEVSRGRLIREPPPGLRHGVVEANIVVILAEYLRQHSIGRVTTNSGVLLSRSPLTVRGPDVSFFTNERLRNAEVDPYFPGAPDLAVEVMSPSNRAADLLEKVAQYFEGGAQLVWVVYPLKRSVVAHCANGDVVMFGKDDRLTAEPVLPDFGVQVADLFA